MLQQPEAETGWPRCPDLKRAGKARPHLPACCRGAGRGRRSRAHHQDRQGRLLRGQGQPPAARQIEGAMIAPEFEQHRPESRAARGLHPGLQQAGHIAHPDQDEPGRIKPELRQARRMQRPGLPLEEILPHQHDRPRFRRPAGQGEHQPARCSGIRALDRVEFMQGPAGEAALQRLVQRRQAKGDPRRRTGRIRRHDPVGEQRPGQPDTSECEIRRGIGHRGRHDSVPVMF